MDLINIFKTRSLSKRLTVSLSTALVLVGAIALAVFFLVSTYQAKLDLELKGQELLKAISETLVLPLWDYDEPQIKAICEAYAKNDLIGVIKISRTDGYSYYNLEKPDVKIFELLTAPIIHKKEHMALLTLGLTSDYYNVLNFRYLRFYTVSLALVILLLYLIINKLLGTYLKTPLSQFVKMVESYALGNKDSFKKRIAYAEFEPFIKVLQKMDSSIQEHLEALHRSQEIYRRIVLTSNEGILALGRDGRIDFANDRMAELLGYRVEEFVDQEVEFFLFEQDIEDHRKRLQERSQGVADQYERRWKHRNGQEVWTIVSATPVLNEEGHFEGSFAMITDISKRKQAEKAIRDSEKRYRLIMESSPDPIVTYDMQGNVIYINPAFTRIFGWTYEEVVGKRIDYVPEEAIAETQAMVDRLNRGESVSGFKTIRYDVNRNIIDIDMSFGTWRTTSGEPGGSVVILRDVTEQNKVAAQLQRAQKMEAIGTLAGGIAHDFNNILTGIFAYAQLAGTHIDNKQKAKKDIEQIIIGAHKATDLVRQILTISRKSIHKKQPLSVCVVVKEALKLLQATIPATIQIRESILSEASVMADPTKIHQVVMNLSTNAYHAMLETGGVLSVGLKEVQFSQKDCVPGTDIVPGKFLKLEIGDAGHGIEPDVLEKIFEPYFTTKGEGEGTGLGLAVVLGIVQEHDGRIEVYSEPGQGTTFHVFFPIIEEVGQPVLGDTVDFPVSGNERILLVDDEEDLLMALKQLLEQLGYQVSHCQTGSQAYESFEKHPDHFDIVVTDMTMPEMTGLELAKKILQIRPSQPVILCTGHSELINKEKALALGIRYYYEKPVIIDELAKVIRTMLNETKGATRGG